jgi:hypothetical protein
MAVGMAVGLAVGIAVDDRLGLERVDAPSRRSSESESASGPVSGRVTRAALPRGDWGVLDMDGDGEAGA